MNVRGSRPRHRPTVKWTGTAVDLVWRLSDPLPGRAAVGGHHDRAAGRGVGRLAQRVADPLAQVVQLSTSAPRSGSPARQRAYSSGYARRPR